jgi:hypothetical protein
MTGIEPPHTECTHLWFRCCLLRGQRLVERPRTGRDPRVLETHETGKVISKRSSDEARSHRNFRGRARGDLGRGRWEFGGGLGWTLRSRHLMIARAAGRWAGSFRRAIGKMCIGSEGRRLRGCLVPAQCRWGVSLRARLNLRTRHWTVKLWDEKDKPTSAPRIPEVVRRVELASSPLAA